VLSIEKWGLAKKSERSKLELSGQWMLLLFKPIPPSKLKSRSLRQP
jgi:hypothetical protein